MAQSEDHLEPGDPRTLKETLDSLRTWLPEAFEDAARALSTLEEALTDMVGVMEALVKSREAQVRDLNGFAEKLEVPAKTVTEEELMQAKVPLCKAFNPSLFAACKLKAGHEGLHRWGTGDK